MEYLANYGESAAQAPIPPLPPLQKDQAVAVIEKLAKEHGLLIERRTGALVIACLA
jgi:hypothetical protein